MHVLKLDMLNERSITIDKALDFIRCQAAFSDRCPDRGNSREHVLRAIYWRHDDVNRLTLAWRTDAVENHLLAGHVTGLGLFQDFLKKLLGLPLCQLFECSSDSCSWIQEVGRDFPIGMGGREAYAQAQS